MNILMLTNTFTPHVGGVARSVEDFTAEFRRRGHRVLVGAPLFEETPEEEHDVVRFPAVQNFNGSDFSVPVPIPGRLSAKLGELQPDIVHSHHPFLLGDTALRVAAARRLPVVFTHHTQYERYTHYVPGDLPRLEHFVIDLVTGYCNLCDGVIAPSESIASLLLERGVERPIEVIPTGIDLERFGGGERAAGRRRAGLPAGAFAVGHVGRLAPEKNLPFLAEAVVRFVQSWPQAHFVVAGEGPSAAGLEERFAEAGLEERLHLLGVLEPPALADVYRAMDVFAFASQSETQGMVLAEAMAAGVPVVAVDASGAREVVDDGVNGRLLERQDAGAFADALAWVARLDEAGRRRLGEGIAATAERFSMLRCAGQTLQLYRRFLDATPREKNLESSLWHSARRLIGKEWEILRNLALALGEAVRSEEDDEEELP